MTYTVLAACPRTRRVGVGIATYSLAVGGYCPWADGHLGVVSTQANVNPKLGPLAPGKQLCDLSSASQATSRITGLSTNDCCPGRRVGIHARHCRDKIRKDFRGAYMSSRSRQRARSPFTNA